jgi:hypothetical protein
LVWGLLKRRPRAFPESWRRAGILEKLMRRMAEYYARECGGIGWRWQAMDSKYSAAPLGGERTGKNPTDRGNSGAKMNAEGYLAVDDRECTMEWGAEAGRDYSGWLTVANRGEGGSEVVVHLSFGERSVEPEMQEWATEGRDPLSEGVSATLESIRRQIVEGSGKVETPPPPEGAEPHPETNPAVVDEDS